MSQPDGKTPSARTRQVLALALVGAVSFVACGGEATPPNDNTSPTTSTVATTSTLPTSDTTTSALTESDQPRANSECSLDAPASCGGSAVLIIAGEVIKFDFFACYYEENAVALFGNEDDSFAAFGALEGGSATSILWVSTGEDGIGPYNSFFYSPTQVITEGEVWQGGSYVRAGMDVPIEGIDSGRISWAGDFERIVDGAHTDETVPASLEATCG
jgi:hypothetical protein